MHENIVCLLRRNFQKCLVHFQEGSSFKIQHEPSTKLVKFGGT